MDDFKNRLVTAMRSKSIRAIDLADKLGCSRGLITQYIQGKCKAKQDMIYRMSKILDVSPSWLMGLDVPMKEDSNELISEINSILNGLSEEDLRKALQMISLMFKK